MAEDDYTVTLGNNDITNCAAALVIEGVEVFRLREDEGELLVECDMFTPTGERVAKIVRNTPEYVAPGYRAHIKPGEPRQVIAEPSGKVLAQFERRGRRHVKITGIFCVKGFVVVLDEAGLHTNDPWEISNNGFNGLGTAISLRRGQMGLGFAPPSR